MRRSFRLICVALAVPAAGLAQEPTVERVEVAGASFPVVQAGEGEPVLFVHGAFSDYRVWEPMREAVAKDHRFIAYTQRQFGTSDWPEEPVYGRDVHETDLIALLDQWGEPILWGSDTLPFFEAAAKEVAACLPNATMEEMPGGHGLPAKDSAAVVERMLAFIDAYGA